MAARRLIDQKKLRARKRKKSFFLSLYALLAIGIVVSGVSFLSWIDELAIREIRVEGAEKVSPDEVRGIAELALAGSYIGLFSKADTLTYPEDDITSSISALPRVRSVDISRDGLNSIVITITERTEAARWCDGMGESCYSMDENGFVFGSSDSDAFAYSGILSDDPVGSQYLSEATFRKIEFFMREIRNLSLEPSGARLSESGYMDIAVRGGGKLLIYTEDDLSSVLKFLQSAVQDKTVAPTLDAFLSTLEYLKLDSGSKIVYKKRD
ncbi:MAG: FtsQ-type POTRA domain-containing protein [Candidatus Paceibacterota bacterium]|jgi:hypothetical protein